MNKLRILICSCHPVFSGSGGAERVFWNMANHFASAGHEVLALGFERKTDLQKPQHFSVDSRVHCENPGRAYKKSPFITLGSLLHPSKKSRDAYRDYNEGLRKSALLKPAVDSFKPDIAVCYQPETAYFLKELLEVPFPVITMLHSNIDTLLKGKERYFKALEDCEIVQVLLPSYIEKLKSYVPKVRGIAIPNAVPSSEQSCDKNSHLIVTSGRISPEKNQLLLIRSFAMVHQGHPNWQLRIWGDTAYDRGYYEACLNEIQKLELGDSVQFCGISPRVTDELAKCAVFAFPSEYEGFPLALAEAMSIKMPCVGFKKCSGVNDLIKDGRSGVLTDDSPEAFANALCALIEDPQKRASLGEQAREKMRRYTPERVWKQWDDLVMQLTEGATA